MKSLTIPGILVLLTAFACSPPTGDGDGDADADGDADIEPADCTPGDVTCRSNEPYICNEAGDAFLPTGAPCGGETPVCVEGRGCAVCAPLSRECDGNTPRECNGDGTAWNVGEPCNEATGEVCEWGICLDPCEAAAEANSYVGCEYWAVDLPNLSLIHI